MQVLPKLRENQPQHSPARLFARMVSLAVLVMMANLSLATTAFDWRAHPHYDVYVTNEGSGDLSVIDGSTWKVVATWKLGKRPRGVAVAKDGRCLFVALSGSPIPGPGNDTHQEMLPDKTADGIGVFDIASGQILTVIRGVSDPEQVAVDGSGENLYVASEDAGTGIVIHIRDGQILATVAVGGEPEGIAVSPVADLVAFTSEAANTLTLVDGRNYSVQHHLIVGARPRDVVFSPDGKLVYVPGESDATLTLINAATGNIIQKISVPGENSRPKGVVVRSDGRRVFVATGRGGRVVAFDAYTLEPLGSTAVGQRPWGLALSPGGRYLYSANGPSNDVSVVDTTDMTVVATIPVGTRPWGVAISAR